MDQASRTAFAIESKEARARFVEQKSALITYVRSGSSGPRETLSDLIMFQRREYFSEIWVDAFLKMPANLLWHHLMFVTWQQQGFRQRGRRLVPYHGS